VSLAPGVVVAVYHSNSARQRLRHVSQLFRGFSDSSAPASLRRNSSREVSFSARDSSGAAMPVLSVRSTCSRVEVLQRRLASARSAMEPTLIGEELHGSLGAFFDTLMVGLRQAMPSDAGILPSEGLEGASAAMRDYVTNTLSQQPTPGNVGLVHAGGSSPLAMPSSMRRQSFSAFVQENSRLETESTVAPESESECVQSRRHSAGDVNSESAISRLHSTGGDSNSVPAALSRQHSHFDTDMVISQASQHREQAGVPSSSTLPTITMAARGSMASIPFSVEQGVHAMMLPLTYRESNGAVDVSPAQLGVVKELGTWRFDIFTLQHQFGRPLVVTAMAALSPYTEQFSIDSAKTLRMLSSLEERYHVSNAYHNAAHAADVTNTVLYWLRLRTSSGLADLNATERMAALCAAAAHDVGHTGKANRFHVSAETPLAMLYNDQSVLENMHCCILFLILHADSSNILAGLEAATRATFRAVVVDMILATDLAKHFNMVSRFKREFLSTPIDAGDSPKDAKKPDGETRPHLDAPQRKELLGFMLKASDVAGSSKPFELHAQWSMRILAEFFAQGDAERDLGLPCSPFCDRQTTNVSESQGGFFDFIVSPLYSAFSEYVDSSRIHIEVLPEITRNREFWRSYNSVDFNSKDPCSNWDVLQRAYVSYHASAEQIHKENVRTSQPKEAVSLGPPSKATPTSRNLTMSSGNRVGHTRSAQVVPSDNVPQDCADHDYDVDSDAGISIFRSMSMRVRSVCSLPMNVNHHSSA